MYDDARSKALKELSHAELVRALENPETYDPISLGYEYLRRFRKRPQTLSFPAHAADYLVNFRKKSQEHFLLITINSDFSVIRVHVVTIGILNKAVVHPREVFIQAIKDRAAAIVIAHNHPSGALKPSEEDEEITRIIKDSGKLIGIRLLDSLIIAEGGYYSFLENGVL